MNRDLDGCYFRVKRDGKWEDLCFSDLTDDEMLLVFEGKSIEFVQSLAMHLAHRLRSIGDMFDISMEE